MQIGILGILTIIFVVAKLAGWIAWSWWLVLLPLYGGLIFALLIWGGLIALAIRAANK